jgi:hypothetical protein
MCNLDDNKRQYKHLCRMNLKVIVQHPFKVTIRWDGFDHFNPKFRSFLILVKKICNGFIVKHNPLMRRKNISVTLPKI